MIAEGVEEGVHAAATAEIDEGEGGFNRVRRRRKAWRKPQRLSNQNLRVGPRNENVLCHEELVFKEMAGTRDVGCGSASAAPSDRTAERRHMTRLQVDIGQIQSQRVAGNAQRMRHQHFRVG